jgi:transketolase
MVRTKPRALKATRDAYGEALLELGRRDRRVVALDAGVSDSTRSEYFGREFPERFFNVGIAEGNLVDVAAGFALTGKIPFASSFAVFLTGRAWESIRQSIAYPALNVKLVGSHGGISIGEDGASAQMDEDLAIMRALPNMTVLCPADAVETARAVFAAAAHPGPVYLRLGRNPVPVLFDASADFAIGRNVTLRQGGDVAVFACGIMVAVALDAADLLAAQGVAATVVNAATIKPLDADNVLALARQTGAVVTAEEHSVIGGLGGAVAELLAEEYPVPVVRVGVQDRFGASGRPDELLRAFGLTAEGVAAAALRAVALKRR